MKVYRCYDNRLRCTERRPDVYEHCPGIPGECHVVLHVADTITPSDSHPFGQLAPPACADNDKKKTKIAKWDWLWKFKGQLKVITTPYHKGKHYATHPNQFLPIVKRLEEMHQSGFVHGDIRAYNMVLNYEDLNEPTGWLIDFDFGGHIDDSPKYPSGYVQDLSDGFRMGKPNERITFEHDWYALGEIIFNLYSLRNKNTTSVSELWVMQNDFCDLMSDGTLSHRAAAERLRAYLSLATEDGFYLKLKYSFRRSLEECNLLQQRNSPRTDSKGATGSPPKPKN